MDIVLEVCDTFAFDHLYSYLFPLKQVAYSSEFLNNGLNKTVERTAEAIGNAWSYTPSTSYLTLTPSAAAYATSWPRDYILRQFLSLFAITWYVYSIHDTQPTDH